MSIIMNFNYHKNKFFLRATPVNFCDITATSPSYLLFPRHAVAGTS